jgi:hypothetical protein
MQQSGTNNHSLFSAPPGLRSLQPRNIARNTNTLPRYDTRCAAIDSCRYQCDGLMWSPVIIVGAFASSKTQVLPAVPDIGPDRDELRAQSTNFSVIPRSERGSSLIQSMGARDRERPQSTAVDWMMSKVVGVCNLQCLILVDTRRESVCRGRPFAMPRWTLAWPVKKI